MKSEDASKALNVDSIFAGAVTLLLLKLKKTPNPRNLYSENTTSVKSSVDGVHGLLLCKGLNVKYRLVEHVCDGVLVQILSKECLELLYWLLELRFFFFF